MTHEVAFETVLSQIIERSGQERTFAAECRIAAADIDNKVGQRGAPDPKKYAPLVLAAHRAVDGQHVLQVAQHHLGRLPALGFELQIEIDPLGEQVEGHRTLAIAVASGCVDRRIGGQGLHRHAPPDPANPAEMVGADGTEAGLGEEGRPHTCNEAEEPSQMVPSDWIQRRKVTNGPPGS